MPTAASLGFRMPAEWEPHAATWIGWPHNQRDWPGKFAPIPFVYGEIVRRLAPGETVRILVNSGAHEAQAKRVLKPAGVDLGRVKFLRVPTNRGWTRDFGPIFVRKDGPLPPAEVAIARFRFNAWAKYKDWKKDDLIPELVAKKLKRRLFRVRAEGQDVVLEGGAIEVNGRGTLVTTEECLLHPTVQARNPKLSRAELEEAIRGALGVTNILWLGRGIAGDDTHGHVDDLCRFVSARTVVMCRERRPKDENHAALEENWERIQDFRLEDGSKVEALELPMPAPLVFDRQRLPASYANFYVGNAAVLVPTFNDPADRTALGLLAECFPDRPVVGIGAVDLVWGLGTIHCLTQQEPLTAAAKSPRGSR